MYRPVLHIPKNPYQLYYVSFSENASHTKRIEIGKGRLIEQPRVHNAARCKVVDHHFDEFMLVSCELAPLNKGVKRSLRRGAIQADHRPHKKAEASLLANPLDLLGRADAGLRKHAF